MWNWLEWWKKYLKWLNDVLFEDPNERSYM